MWCPAWFKKHISLNFFSSLDQSQFIISSAVKCLSSHAWKFIINSEIPPNNYLTTSVIQHNRNISIFFWGEEVKILQKLKWSFQQKVCWKFLASKNFWRGWNFFISVSRSIKHFNIWKSIRNTKVISRSPRLLKELSALIPERLK